MAKKKTDSKKKTVKKKVAKKTKAGKVDRKDRDKKQETEAVADYEKLLADAQKLKDMTDNKAWQDHYAWMKDQIRKHSTDILKAEKTREFIQHQEAVKALQLALEEIRKPINRMQDFVNSMPLFAAKYHTRAQWNEATGRVDFRSV